MKAIGAGYGRMGTMSIKAALEQIGYGPCFHMIDVIRDPSLLPPWKDAAEGKEVDWVKRPRGLGVDDRLAGLRVLARAPRDLARPAGDPQHP